MVVTETSQLAGKTFSVGLDVRGARHGQSEATLRGVSTAFEAQVNVELRADQSLAAIGTGYVMGGSMGQLASFEGQIGFTETTARYGTLLMRTYSAKDGSVLEAAALRIMYAK